jgi:hypothetical protein
MAILNHLRAPYIIYHSFYAGGSKIEKEGKPLAEVKIGISNNSIKLSDVL